MSDFARMMEIAIAADAPEAQKALGTPPPSLAEQLKANEEAVAKENAATARPGEERREQRQEMRDERRDKR